MSLGEPQIPRVEDWKEERVARDKKEQAPFASTREQTRGFIDQAETVAQEQYEKTAAILSEQIKNSGVRVEGTPLATEIVNTSEIADALIYQAQERNRRRSWKDKLFRRNIVKGADIQEEYWRGVNAALDEAYATNSHISAEDILRTKEFQPKSQEQIRNEEYIRRRFLKAMASLKVGSEKVLSPGAAISRELTLQGRISINPIYLEAERMGVDAAAIAENIRWETLHQGVRSVAQKLITRSERTRFRTK